MQKPKVTSTTDYSNIKLDQESIDIEFSTGNIVRLFLDRSTNRLRLVVDDQILQHADDDGKFQRILELDSFYRD